MQNVRFPSCLPGKLILEDGTSKDYFELERFHYRPVRPSTWCRVLVVRYYQRRCRARLAAVGVLSWPVPMVRARNQWFHLRGMSLGQHMEFANTNLRTISRVIVHPTFRAVGLASFMIRQLCAVCPTRYVEAMAMMGRIHPMFEVAGMIPIIPESEEKPVYYILDRSMTSPSARGTNSIAQ